MSSSLSSYLSTHPVFQRLEKQELEKILSLVSEEVIPESSYIFLEQEKAHHFYILKEGVLQARIGAKMIATIKPGQIFGEIAVLNDSFRSGSVFAVEESKVIKVDGKELIHGNSIPVEISFKILKELIKPLISLHYTNEFFRRTGDIIREGETDRIEFKSTLRHNIHTGKFGREIEHAALKTIAAFLNSWGGILLVGVEDKGNILGIDNDKFENDDRALLHLTQMVNERLGTHFMQFINAAIETIESKKIIRIDVLPSNLPAYLANNNDEYFYIRTGPSTTELKPSQIYEYIDNRFFRPRG
jgi:signal-transduction protein with cAMP-binding, CBS, and nucleotidyltransferase domain